MELAQLMILVGFIGSCSMLFYVLTNLVLILFGVRAREYSTNADSSAVSILSAYVGKTYAFSTSTNSDKVPIGLVFGKWYVAYVTTVNIQKRDSVSIGYNITFWTTESGHTKSMSDNCLESDVEKGLNGDEKSDCTSNVANTIEIWRHSGSFKSESIEKFNIWFCNEECAQQSEVVRHMKQMVQTSIENGYGNRLVVMIAGPSGTGKSQIAKQFTKAVGGTLADDFHPTHAGENFASLIKTVKPSKKKPLVVLLDEGDKTFHRIQNETIKEHEFLVIPVTDKASHNTFMDRLVEHDNVFIIITMNSSFDDIDRIDPSYTRSGRVDLKVNFGGDDSYNPSNLSNLSNPSNGADNFLHIHPFENVAADIHHKRFTPKPRSEIPILPSGGKVEGKVEETLKGKQE